MHYEAIRYARERLEIVPIGHRGHDEVVGTFGEAPESIHIVQSVDDVGRLSIPESQPIAYLTQTTLSHEDAKVIVRALKERYAMLSESDEERDRRRLVDLIQRKGGSINGRELVQSSRAYRTVDDANAALDDLAKNGYGSWQTPEQRGPGGPKAPRFVLAAGVNVYNNPAADSANGNTVDVDTVDARDAGEEWEEVA